MDLRTQSLPVLSALCLKVADQEPYLGSWQAGLFKTGEQERGRGCGSRSPLSLGSLPEDCTYAGIQLGPESEQGLAQLGVRMWWGLLCCLGWKGADRGPLCQMFRVAVAVCLSALSLTPEAPILFKKKLEPQTVEERSSVTLGVELTRPWPEVKWTRNAVALAPGENVAIYAEGSIHRLVLRSAGFSDRGFYGCETPDDKTQAKLTVESELRGGWAWSALRSGGREGSRSPTGNLALGFEREAGDGAPPGGLGGAGWQDGRRERGGRAGLLQRAVLLRVGVGLPLQGTMLTFEAPWGGEGGTSLKTKVSVQ